MLGGKYIDEDSCEGEKMRMDNESDITVFTPCWNLLDLCNISSHQLIS
jgi:hypothetical protein